MKKRSKQKREDQDTIPSVDFIGHARGYLIERHPEVVEDVLELAARD